jgi:hypothetical protein
MWSMPLPSVSAWSDLPAPGSHAYSVCIIRSVRNEASGRLQRALEHTGSFRTMSVVTAMTRNQTRPILIGAAVLLSLGMGLRQSLGLFLPPVTRDLGLTAADFTLAIAVQNVVWGVSQAAVGALADRFGCASR